MTSDNGGLVFSRHVGHQTSRGCRGSKNTPFEGGHRVPFIAKWPDVISPNSTSDSLVGGTDLLATIAAVAESPFTDDQAKDSHTFLPILRGDETFQSRSELFLQGGSNNELIIRRGSQKLIMKAKDGLSHDSIRSREDVTVTHFFDLAKNQGEKEGRNMAIEPTAAQKKTMNELVNLYWTARISKKRTAPSYGKTVAAGNSTTIR